MRPSSKHHSSRIASLLLVFVAGAGAAAVNACGDDGDTTSSATAATTGSTSTTSGTPGGTGGGGPGGTGGGAGTGGAGGGVGGSGGGGPDPNCPPDPTGAIPPLKLTEIATGLNQPIFVTGAPNDTTRLYVVLRSGRIRIIKDGTLLPDPFLDVSGIIQDGSGEQGLLGLAFHPNYAQNGRFFVYYTADNANDSNTVAEYTRSNDPDVANPMEVKQYIAITDFAGNHNGGMLAFGKDGYLYIGTGDGGGGGDPNETGQDKMSQLGKILRVDVENHPTPPPGNLPMADQYVFHYGLRNPWRFSFDRCTDDLYIGDVGQNCYEEIDVTPAGSGPLNFGWDVAEGNHCYNEGNPNNCNFNNCSLAGFTPPVAELNHSEGHCSITGGYVYRGTKIPNLVGTYIYGDYCSRRVFSFKWSNGMAMDQAELTNDLESDNAGDIASFGEDTAGELYLVTLNGKVFRIEAE
jgi:glucose/arabinose dehydrogenase